MNRIVNSGSGVAPAYMVANFNGSVSAPGSGNILIEGGSWVFDGQTAAGVPMAFVDGTGILVRNTQLRTLARTAAVLFAGCTNSAADGVQLTSTSAPGGARSAYSTRPPASGSRRRPAVISGLNSGMYTNAPCTSASSSGAAASPGPPLGRHRPLHRLRRHRRHHGGLPARSTRTSSSPGTPPWRCRTTPSTRRTGRPAPSPATSSASTTARCSPSAWNPSAPGSTNQVIANNTNLRAPASTDAYKSSNSSRAHARRCRSTRPSRSRSWPMRVYEVRASIPYGSGSVPLKYDFAAIRQFNYTSTREALLQSLRQQRLCITERFSDAQARPTRLTTTARPSRC